MTAGTTVVGSPIASGGTYYYRRDWTGGDSKYVSVEVRPAWTSVSYRKLRTYDSSRKKWVTDLSLVFHHHRSKKVRRAAKSQLHWNNYQYAMELGQQTANSNGFFATPTTSAEHPHSAVVLSSAGNMRLQSRLLSKIKGHQFQLGVSLAQADKTVLMATQTVRKLTRFTHLLKRGRLSDAARALGISDSGNTVKRGLTSNDVSNLYLEYQFGWVPLLSDVHACAQASAYFMDRPRTSLVRASITEKFEYFNDYTFGEVRTTQSIKRVITCRLREQLSAPRSLGLLDPLSIVWEVVPFSFVVDWFIPIGTYLENFNQIPSIDGQFMTTDIVESKFMSHGNGVATGAVASRRFQTVNRVTSDTLTPETPSFRGIDKLPSTTHFFESLALFSQAVLKNSRV